MENGPTVPVLLRQEKKCSLSPGHFDQLATSRHFGRERCPCEEYDTQLISGRNSSVPGALHQAVHTATQPAVTPLQGFALRFFQGALPRGHMVVLTSTAENDPGEIVTEEIRPVPLCL